MADSKRAEEPIVGIDLGTTNSLVAIAGWPPDEPAPAAPRVIPDEGGRPLFPSVVRFEARGGRAVPAAVGSEARAGAVEHPRTTVASVKRLMGRSLQDAAPDIPYLSFEVVAGPHDTARVWVAASEEERRDGSREGAMVSPQEVSAIILSRLREQASRALGVTVNKAVVTVPAYFDDAQRQATRDAGRLAGLDVVRIVNEPTAAALAYGLGLRAGGGGKEEVIAVYDLGGGTFDISILRLTPGAGGTGIGADCFEVLATAGDTHLGGDDFDHSLVKLFTDEINARFAPSGETLSFPPETRRALVEFAESTRIRLSDRESVSIRIDLGEGRIYERAITRAELEELIAPMVDRTIECCRRALRDARRAMEGEKVVCVVMVGGATRTPLVRRRVGEFFQLDPYTALDPDLVVALGAAIQASVLFGSAAGTLLLDVVPLSLGIETMGGGVAKLIMRNSTVPAQATEMFSTSADGQTSIKLNIVQGEREMASDCRSLGEFHLAGIPPMPAGIPKVRVSFLVDANGILSVSAVEERSGKRAAVQIVPNHGLTRQEVERMEAESFAHAREDMTRHRIADLVVNAELDLKWIAPPLERVRGLLDPSYVTELESKLARLRELTAAARQDWRSVDANEFHKAKEAVDAASVSLHEVAITESLRATQ
jgi:molecular chaperone DnaK (HSP70)